MKEIEERISDLEERTKPLTSERAALEDRLNTLRQETQKLRELSRRKETANEILRTIRRYNEMREIGIKEVKKILEAQKAVRKSVKTLKAINSEALARRKKLPHLAYVHFNLPEAVKNFAERKHDITYTKRPITIQDYHPPPGTQTR